MGVSLIVAFSENRVIGHKGKIPWDIPGEKNRFKELTTGNVVIMGRNTFQEIGRPLPNRYTILVSSTMKYEDDNCTTVSSLQEALSLAGSRDIYISGGERIYKEAIDMHIVDKMFITEVHKMIHGDAFFPQLSTDEYRETFRENYTGKIPYTYITLEKNK